jgi:hypothetical protein
MMPGSSLPKLAECRDCHEPIRFVRMADTGRALPVNPQPDPQITGHGTVAARLAGGQLVGFVTTRDRLAGYTHPYRFRPHFATCEARAKKKSTPTPSEPDQALF